MKDLRRVLCSFVALAGVCAVVLLSVVLATLERFELQPLYRLLGFEGIAYLAFLLVGLLLLSRRFGLAAVRPERAVLGDLSRIGGVGYLVWTLLTVWLLDWTFIEHPLSARFTGIVSGKGHDELLKTITSDSRIRRDLAAFGIEPQDASAERLAVMLKRIRVNRPQTLKDVAIGPCIQRYAQRYDVDPALLLGWLYLDSFYGEAAAGPMPMFRELTGETFRDLIQLHLPAWFIESPFRSALIEGEMLETIGGERIGRKLRYALHKATYDLSLEPYEADVFSDVLLMMTVYPDAFAREIASDGVLRQAYGALDEALKRPFFDPYAHPDADTAYYREHRRNLIRFARSVTYRMLLDFEFATKVQALIARFYNERFQSELGSDTWAAVPRIQKIALQAMIVDVYVPNIGSLAYNLYMLPEFNLAPFRYVATAVREDLESLMSTDMVWRPPQASRLWGGPALKLRVALEVAAALGVKVPEEEISDSVAAAMQVVAAQR